MVHIKVLVPESCHQSRTRIYKVLNKVWRAKKFNRLAPELLMSAMKTYLEILLTIHERDLLTMKLSCSTSSPKAPASVTTTKGMDPTVQNYHHPTQRIMNKSTGDIIWRTSKRYPTHLKDLSQESARAITTPASSVRSSISPTTVSTTQDCTSNNSLASPGSLIQSLN